jgi:hypothetical protein
MHAIKRVLLFCIIFCFPVIAFCWGMLGHRIVGEIADSYLTAKARAEVKKILGDTTIAIAANWGDFIKSDPAYDSLEKWHYIDIDSGLSKAQAVAELKKDTSANLYTKSLFVISQLKNKQLSMDKKRMYLKLLIHFVGDMHQPLHVGRKNYKGGNRIRVQWFNNQSNLHVVWDESLISYQQLTYKDYAEVINHTTASQRAAWQKQPIAEWMAESYLIAEALFSEIKEENQKLSYRYNFLHVATVNQQLLKGGVRLAGLLNEIFK